MSYSFKTKNEEIIWNIIESIKNDVRKNQIGDYNNFFHRDIVIVSPDFKQRGEGREACINSYRSMLEQAVIHDLKVSDPQIDVCENNAVATLHNDMKWVLDYFGYSF